MARAPAAAPAGRLFLLEVPFAQRRAAQAAGARWDEGRRAWAWRGERLPQALLPFRPPPYSLERLLEDRANRVRRAPSRPAKEVSPRPHQEEAIALVRRIRRAGRAGALIGDAVGLGKTWTAWLALRDDPTLASVLVVCPLAVAPHWRATIQAAGDGGKEVAVVNYDRLQRLFALPADGKKRKLKGKARDGEAMAFDAVVWDEAHRLRNPDSARAKFARKIDAKAAWRLWLSATAGENPLQLSYLAPLLAKATGTRPSEMKDFAAWLAAEGLGVAKQAFGRWAWTGDPGAEGRVRDLLYGGPLPLGIRRRPEDVAGWPEMERIPFPLDLEPEAAALYEDLWRDFRKSLGLGLQGQRNPKDALSQRMRFRQKASLLRLDGAAALVEDLLENGMKVAVSVAFQETLEALRERLSPLAPVCEIHGRQTGEEKEAERRRFQGGDARVCVFTVEEGISLHQGEIAGDDAPRALVIHDVRWSAIQMEQIEGRTHRDGKFAPAYWTFAPGTIDERILEVVLAKVRTMRAMQGDETATTRAIEEALLGGAP